MEILGTERSKNELEVVDSIVQCKQRVKFNTIKQFAGVFLVVLINLTWIKYSDKVCKVFIEILLPLVHIACMVHRAWQVTHVVYGKWRKARVGRRHHRKS